MILTQLKSKEDQIMKNELLNLSTETLEKLHAALNDATTELRGDMDFTEAIRNEAYYMLTSVEMEIFRALRAKYLTEDLAKK